jgi:hypothetical protein
MTDICFIPADANFAAIRKNHLFAVAFDVKCVQGRE